MPHKLFEQACEQSKGLATFDQVQNLLRDHIGIAAGIKTLALQDAHGAVLASDVTAPRPVPTFSNSAIDGYAFAFSSLAENSHQLEITGEIFAGETPKNPLAPGQAVRIFTGAVMPENADTCLMQENATTDKNILTVPEGISKGANTRLAGEDLATGDTVVARGTRLGAAQLGAIATTGIDKIPCHKPLRVALLSTGNEVVRPGDNLQPGQIYDSNFHLLSGLAHGQNIILDDIGILADDEKLVFATIKKLAQSHDVILSTGGASVGDRDFIIAAIEKLGILHSWKIAIKPGRPLAIGQIGNAVFLGLPGNPVAAFNTWLLFAIPVFAYMQGENWTPPQRFLVAAGFAMPNKKTGRREFLRGWIEETTSGPVVRKFERDGSGLISGLTRATGLIELSENLTGVKSGDLVSFIPFSSFANRS
ncbi:Molybdopterin molybdenumtransferase [hydrothermal vent metagenome]|uniref:Molybdopterin molybdenumtransferase n=1 Tax=hydrothermal vent metagenome TaxID=652676 RepID=A0A3B0RL96_9ZZZZ